MIFKLGIDVDGVLADFVTAYKNLYIATTGRDTFNGTPCWDFDLAAGYTKEERSVVIKIIN